MTDDAKERFSADRVWALATVALTRCGLTRRGDLAVVETRESTGLTA